MPRLEHSPKRPGPRRTFESSVARMSAPENDDAVELLTWDAADGSEEDEVDELEEELPADEAFDPDDGETDAVTLEEVAADGYAKRGPASLPQPSRARSHPDLPRIKATSLKVKRFIT